MSRETRPCPNCGRPIGFEYREVETGKCQLWRCISEHHAQISPATIRDCFQATATRIESLITNLAETTASKKAAQNALRRQHEAASKRVAMFPDNARIE